MSMSIISNSVNVKYSEIYLTINSYSLLHVKAVLLSLLRHNAQANPRSNKAECFVTVPAAAARCANSSSQY